MSEIKLLPCPFCGGEAEVKFKFVTYNHDCHRTDFYVRCKKCDCQTGAWVDSEEVAGRIWNTRKPMQEILERLEDLKQHNLNEAQKCSEFENFQVYMNDNRGFYRDNAKCYEVAIGVVKEVGGMNESNTNNTVGR